MILREEFTCPLELAHDMIKGKWKPIILWRLRLGRTSLAKLEKDIKGITQKMLIQHINELMEYGLVDKVKYEGYPLKVEYFLTPEKGTKMIECLEILQEIGMSYMVEKGQKESIREMWFKL
ncbi:MULTISPECIES: helix-turn-helix domain-containing protein [unclassified Clostridium]|uniref:winged helix-turn-helix transcriptional regulator n=1 Tax=unclassified Clostridium TaxID=2614128 RepID=UPI000297EBB5|nr:MULTISPECIES: helix-turn-helix domain-containing protein [unclassified Clostridium]EKQ53164.1 MAG: putative transcriptional regulator [Clostridium sp. Maddingley MBC34-26]